MVFFQVTIIATLFPAVAWVVSRMCHFSGLISWSELPAVHLAVSLWLCYTTRLHLRLRYSVRPRNIESLICIRLLWLWFVVSFQVTIIATPFPAVAWVVSRACVILAGVHFLLLRAIAWVVSRACVILAGEPVNYQQYTVDS